MTEQIFPPSTSAYLADPYFTDIRYGTSIMGGQESAERSRADPDAISRAALRDEANGLDVWSAAKYLAVVPPAITEASKAKHIMVGTLAIKLPLPRACGWRDQKAMGDAAGPVDWLECFVSCFVVFAM